jgi:hypothetical protein
MALETPPGSSKRMMIGGDWCGARNSLAKECLDGDYTHLWFMDDDHSFPPDLLMQLLAWDRDLVTPVCLTRVYPFAPVSYVVAPPERQHEAEFMPIDLADCASSGLVQIVAGGCAGMLIKREVLEATRGMSFDYNEEARSEQEMWTTVGDRWFEYGDRSEDIVFCEKAVKAGFRIYADLGARLGHITTAVAIPHWDADNGWTTKLRVGTSYDILIKNAYDLIGRDTYVTPEEVSVGPAAPDDDDLPPLPLNPQQPEPWAPARKPEPPGYEPHLAERIEIWVDDDMIWWWRAIDEEGVVLARNSAIREPDVIAQATAAYPECADSVFQIARELDDSRNVQQFGPPRRLWNREPT